MAPPVRAATARLAPVKNSRTSEARAFAGLRRGLLFENRMQKMRNPACASFFEVAKQAHSVPQFYFRFFSHHRESVLFL